MVFEHSLRAIFVLLFVLFELDLRAIFVPHIVLFELDLRAIFVSHIVLIGLDLRAIFVPQIVLIGLDLRAIFVPLIVLFELDLRAIFVPQIVLCELDLRAIFVPPIVLFELDLRAIFVPHIVLFELDVPDLVLCCFQLCVGHRGVVTRSIPKILSADAAQSRCDCFILVLKGRGFISFVDSKRQGASFPRAIFVLQLVLFSFNFLIVLDGHEHQKSTSRSTRTAN